MNLLSAYHKAKFAAIIIKGKILDDNSQQQNIFNRQNSTADDQSAHLSTTSEITSTSDDYSNDDESSLNSVELGNQMIEPGLESLNKFNNLNNYNRYNDEFIELEDSEIYSANRC